MTGWGVRTHYKDNKPHRAEPIQIPAGAMTKEQAEAEATRLNERYQKKEGPLFPGDVGPNLFGAGIG